MSHYEERGGNRTGWVPDADDFCRTCGEEHIFCRCEGWGR